MKNDKIDKMKKLIKMIIIENDKIEKNDKLSLLNEMIK